jgi:hypothetical protein
MEHRAYNLWLTATAATEPTKHQGALRTALAAKFALALDRTGRSPTALPDCRNLRFAKNAKRDHGFPPLRVSRKYSRIELFVTMRRLFSIISSK